MKREGSAKDPVEEGPGRGGGVPPLSAHTGQMEEVYYRNTLNILQV